MPCSARGRPSSMHLPRSGSPRSTTGWQRSARIRAERAGRRAEFVLELEARRISLGCRLSCAAPPRRRPTERGRAGQACHHTSRSSVEPFLQFSDRRDLREKIFEAWIAARRQRRRRRTTRPSSRKRSALRAERAQLLGYETFAHFGSTTPWRRRPRPRARAAGASLGAGAPAGVADRERCRQLVQAEGDNFKLAPWDWRYYAEKLAQLRCDLDESDDQALFPARPHHRGGVLHRATGCLA